MAVWVRSNISVHIPQIATLPFMESIILCIKSSSIILLTLYIPPDAAIRYYECINYYIINQLDQTLMEFPDYDIILCGDLNKFNVHDICMSFGLVNKYNKPTYGNSQLDYILISEDISDLYCISDCCPVDKSKTPHISLLATPRTNLTTGQGIMREVYDLRSSNLQLFMSKTQQIDWEFIEDSDISLNEKCIQFHEALLKAAHDSIPVSYVCCTQRDKPWITPKIKDLINKRWASYRNRNFPLYNHFKSKVQKEISTSKIKWTKRLQCKDLWKAVNAHRGTKSCDPIYSLISDYESTDKAITAINNELTSVFVADTTSTLNVSKYESREQWNIEITPQIVYDLINRIPNHKASTDIPTVLYKHASMFIAEPLTRLFQLSIKHKCVPEIWKKSFICPLPKSSPPNICNLRPISILPVPERILETIILGSTKEAFLKNYDDCQYGYRPHSSTQCAVVSLHEKLTSYLDDSSTCGTLIVSYDYKKAFDKLRYDLIIERLMDCGFPRDFVLWISDYFRDRKQSVKIGMHTSRTSDVSSGVPQGSTLGPYLYAITTATYCKSTALCHMIKYADDTTFCFPIYQNSTNEHILNEHNRFLSWSQSMSLDLNFLKCKSLIIRKRNYNVDITLRNTINTDCLNVLGVWFNAKGNWSTHVDSITKTASKRLYALRTLKPCLSHSNLKLTYFMLVRSVMEYCCPVFISLDSSDRTRLDVIQRRFHKILCGKTCDEDCLQNLNERRQTLSMKFLKQIMIPNHILHFQLPTKSPTGRFLLPKRATVRRSKSFMLTACEMYNNSCFSR